jgi:hypothetical protein
MTHQSENHGGVSENFNGSYWQMQTAWRKSLCLRRLTESLPGRKPHQQEAAS